MQASYEFFAGFFPEIMVLWPLFFPGAPPAGPLQGPYGAPWGLAVQGSGGRGALWQLGWAVGLWLSAGFWLASKDFGWISAGFWLDFILIRF